MQQVQNTDVSSYERTREGRPLKALYSVPQRSQRLLLYTREAAQGSDTDATRGAGFQRGGKACLGHSNRHFNDARY